MFNKNRTRRPWLRLLVFATLLMVSFAFVAPSYGAEKSEQQMVYGKPYWTEPVQGEPGKWWVNWGEERMKWEPQFWQADYIHKKGPSLYIDYANRHINGPQWPYNIPDSEFEKLSAKDIWGYYYISYLFPTYEDFTEEFWGALEGPKGNKYSAGGLEWIKRYRKSAECAEGAVDWKYLFVQTNPEDVAGVGMLQIVYCGEKTEDNFLYTPTTRKVRRLASASRQDFVPRTLWRNEDNGLCKPIHNYKITGTKILGAQPKEFPGWDPDDKRGLDMNWRGEDRRMLRGYGEPCLVMEVTPYREKWWFAKSIYCVGAKTKKFWWNEVFDQEGRLIRRMSLHQQIIYRPEEAGEPDPMPYMAVAASSGMDYKTGYFQTVYFFNQYINTGMPEETFQENMLTRELNKQFYWK